MKDCKYESKIEHSEHHDNHEDTENCSPFCMCSCCGQTISYEFISTIEFQNQTLKHNEVSKFQSALISEYSISIWQPPKIS